jgi:hypothetical protein
MLAVLVVAAKMLAVKEGTLAWPNCLVLDSSCNKNIGSLSFDLGPVL